MRCCATTGWAVAATAPRKPPPQQKPLFEMMDHWMLLVNPPDHTRLRSLVHKAFTPRMVAQLRGEIQRVTDELLDRVQGQGQMDLIADLAYPLPVTRDLRAAGRPAGRPRRLPRLVGRDRPIAGLDRGDRCLRPRRQAAVALTDYLDGLLARAARPAAG